jgi:hypothetical protein
MVHRLHVRADQRHAAEQVGLRVLDEGRLSFRRHNLPPP